MTKRDLEELVRLAREAGASTLLLLPGQQPVCRVGKALQPPISVRKLTFYDTKDFADAVLSPEDAQRLEESGSVEVSADLAGELTNVTVFYGNGSHHLVIYLVT